MSALYVRADGPYPALVEDWWDEARDARLYAGPNPVVAHPPCARWGNFWWAGRKVGRGLGEDDGCFACALNSVRAWGGVLEHPSGSRAWAAFGLPTPIGYDWTEADERPYTPDGLHAWSIAVRQHEHGHAAHKLTWLLYVGTTQPRALDYHPPSQTEMFAGLSRGTRPVELMGKRERELTPEPFARLLVDLAAGAG